MPKKADFQEPRRRDLRFRVNDAERNMIVDAFERAGLNFSEQARAWAVDRAAKLALRGVRKRRG